MVTVQHLMLVLLNKRRWWQISKKQVSLLALSPWSSSAQVVFSSVHSLLCWHCKTWYFGSCLVCPVWEMNLNTSIETRNSFSVAHTHRDSWWPFGRSPSSCGGCLWWKPNWFCAEQASGRGWNMFAWIQLWHQSLVSSAQALAGSESFICTGSLLWKSLTGAQGLPNRLSTEAVTTTKIHALVTQEELCCPASCRHCTQTYISTERQSSSASFSLRLICLFSSLFYWARLKNFPYDTVPSFLSWFSGPEFTVGFAPFRNLPIWELLSGNSCVALILWGSRQGQGLCPRAFL